MSTCTWPFLEPDRKSILATEENPIGRIADGGAAAVILRRAFSPQQCESLIQFLIDQKLMFDGRDDRIDGKALDTNVFDKYLGKGLNDWDTRHRRIDIGASLGNFGDDKEKFLELADEANRLFESLFAERDNPISLIYDNLQQLAPGKRVTTAYEPDGRKYSPAIFRVHYGGFTYGPHFDSVRNREHRTNYAVHKYPSQLAGVLCLQNTTANGMSAQAILHRQFWNEEVGDVLASQQFPQYAAEHSIPNARVELEPGDLYFFNTGLIHEVPGVNGDQPRAVLATFIGYGEDEDEIMVWS